MKTIIIGAGGFGREILDTIYQINFLKPKYELIGFIDNGIKKGTIVICEHSLDLDIKNNILWEIYDVRSYGQSKLTFLIHI